MTVRLGATQDGTLTAIHHRSFGTAGIAGGAGHRRARRATSTRTTPNCKVEEHDVFTNAGPAAPLRAPGHPQGAFALESAIDELAEKLGWTRSSCGGRTNPARCASIQYDIGAKAIGWERRNKKAGETAPDRASAGIGMANGNWYVIARGAPAWARR